MFFMIIEIFKGLLIALGNDAAKKWLNSLWTKLSRTKRSPEIRQITEACDLFTNSLLKYSKLEIKNIAHINKNEENEVISA
jgi:hypothetical protein